MDQDLRPSQRAGLLVEELDAQFLLYRVGDHRAIHLNETATAIFQLCDGSRSVREIVGLLKEAYPDAGDAVETDVLEAIDYLAAEGVLEPIADA